MPARRSRTLALTVLVSSVACVPELPGEAELYALTPIAIHAEVVTSGNLGVPASIDGRARGELLPGDVVRLSSVLADASGPVDPTQLEISWFLCSPWDFGTGEYRDCFDADLVGGPGLPDCPAGAYVGALPYCRLGEGASIEFLFAPPYVAELVSGLANLSVTMIARDPRVSDESCERRLAADPVEDVSDCAIQQRQITLGPESALVDALDARGLVNRFEYPPELWSLEPDLNPRVAGFALRELETGAVREVAPREAVTVAPGERFTVEPILDDRDVQVFHIDEDGVEYDELMFWRWGVTPPAEVIAVGSLAAAPTDPITIEAPREPGASFYVFLQLRELRGSQVGEWLRLDTR